MWTLSKGTSKDPTHAAPMSWLKPMICPSGDIKKMLTRLTKFSWIASGDLKKNRQSSTAFTCSCCPLTSQLKASLWKFMWKTSKFHLPKWKKYYCLKPFTWYCRPLKDLRLFGRGSDMWAWMKKHSDWTAKASA